MGVRWIRAAALAVTIFVAGVAAGAALQQQAGGTRREPQFENEHVRVWKSIIMPNQPLTLHRHEHGRTIVALKGGTLDVDPSGEQHGDLNKGKDPIEVIVVEMRK